MKWDRLTPSRWASAAKGEAVALDEGRVEPPRPEEHQVNGGFLGAGGAANRDNNYILDHVARLRSIPVHVVHGRYDRVCHLYQAEALVRALRDAGNSAVNYLITTAGHSSFEPETDTRLRTIMSDLPPMTLPETASLQ